MTKIQKYLASNIKTYRNLLSLTQEQLAEKVGTSTNYIGTIETCKKFPSPKMIEKIASALNIDSSQLFQNPNLYQNNTNIDLGKLKKSILKNLKTAVDTSFFEI